MRDLGIIFGSLILFGFVLLGVGNFFKDAALPGHVMERQVLKGQAASARADAEKLRADVQKAKEELKAAKKEAHDEVQKLKDDLKVARREAEDLKRQVATLEKKLTVPSKK